MNIIQIDTATDAPVDDIAYKIVKYIEENFTNENVSFVDSKGLGHKDLIYDDVSAQAIIERFKDSDVDAVFIINCNF